MIGDLEAVAIALQKAMTMTRAAEVEYYRKFMPIAVYLEKVGKVSKYQVSKAYLSGFTDSVAGRIRYRVEPQNPTIDPADGFNLDQLHSAMKMVLDAVGFGGGGMSSIQMAVALATVKVEAPDMNTLVQSITAAMLQAQAQQEQQGRGRYYHRPPQGRGYWPYQGGYQVQYQGGGNVGPGGGQGSGATRWMCNFCDSPDHFVAGCPEVEKYYKEGKICLSQEGRVLLMNVGPVPRHLPGNCMKD